MINRTMVRTRVIQTLFAYYQLEDNTPSVAQKALLKSYNSTYSLYMLMLDFINELTAYAEQQIAEQQEKARITHKLYVPNWRFTKNKFAAKIFENRQLKNYINNEHLCWDAGMNAVKSVYRQLQISEFYKQYMTQLEDPSYEEDRELWKQIFTNIVLHDSELPAALEDMEISMDYSNWETDLDVVLAFVIKTIRQFKAKASADHQLLPMFANEEELNFGAELLQYEIDNHEEYSKLIVKHLKNWDADRIAYMDKVIITTCLAEIIHCNDIALEVSLDEYIEMAKEYSGDKSYLFVNGILNEILRDLNREGKVLKMVK